MKHFSNQKNNLKGKYSSYNNFRNLCFLFTNNFFPATLNYLSGKTWETLKFDACIRFLKFL